MRHALCVTQQTKAVNRKQNKTILALGADIKNRFLLADGKNLYFGPTMGDLGNTNNYELFKKELEKIIKKYDPSVIAYDFHPTYFSSAIAKRTASFSKHRAARAT